MSFECILNVTLMSPEFVQIVQKYFRKFLNVPWMCHECNLNVTWMYPECPLNVSWMSPECECARNFTLGVILRKTFWPTEGWLLLTCVKLWKTYNICQKIYFYLTMLSRPQNYLTWACLCIPFPHTPTQKLILDFVYILTLCSKTFQNKNSAWGPSTKVCHHHPLIIRS